MNNHQTNVPLLKYYNDEEKIQKRVVIVVIQAID